MTRRTDTEASSAQEKVTAGSGPACPTCGQKKKERGRLATTGAGVGIGLLKKKLQIIQEHMKEVQEKNDILRRKQLEDFEFDFWENTFRH